MITVHEERLTNLGFQEEYKDFSSVEEMAEWIKEQSKAIALGSDLGGPPAIKKIRYTIEHEQK